MADTPNTLQNNTPPQARPFQERAEEARAKVTSEMGLKGMSQQLFDEYVKAQEGFAARLTTASLQERNVINEEIRKFNQTFFSKLRTLQGAPQSPFQTEPALVHRPHDPQTRTIRVKQGLNWVTKEIKVPPKHGAHVDTSEPRTPSQADETARHDREQIENRGTAVTVGQAMQRWNAEMRGDGVVTGILKNITGSFSGAISALVGLVGFWKLGGLFMGEGSWLAKGALAIAGAFSLGAVGPTMMAKVKDWFEHTSFFQKEPQTQTQVTRGPAPAQQQGQDTQVGAAPSLSGIQVGKIDLPPADPFHAPGGTPVQPGLYNAAPAPNSSAPKL